MIETTSIGRGKNKKTVSVVGGTKKKEEKKKAGRNKFNVSKDKSPRTADNIVFHSKKEKDRYVVLKLLEKNGEIKDLKLQVRFGLSVNKQLICEYWADFTYTRVQTKQYIVEDVKGMLTDVYRLKKKLMKAVLGIEIYET